MIAPLIEIEGWQIPPPPPPVLARFLYARNLKSWTMSQFPSNFSVIEWKNALYIWTWLVPYLIYLIFLLFSQVYELNNESQNLNDTLARLVFASKLSNSLKWRDKSFLRRAKKTEKNAESSIFFFGKRPTDTSIVSTLQLKKN